MTEVTSILALIMKKTFILAACVYVCTAMIGSAYSEYSSKVLSKNNPFAIIPGEVVTTSLMLDATGGRFADDGATVRVYEPDTEDSLVLYSNGGEFSDGTTMKSYQKNTLTLDAGSGTFEDGASKKRYLTTDETETEENGGTEN